MKSILLLPIGNADPELAEGLLAPLAESFRADVTVAASDLNLGEFFDPQRVQYNSTDIIHHISTDHIASLPETENSDESTKILAVSDGDLFIPILTYVFGEAELGGRWPWCRTTDSSPRGTVFPRTVLFLSPDSRRKHCMNSRIPMDSCTARVWSVSCACRHMLRIST